MASTSAAPRTWKRNRGIFMRDGIEIAIERLAWITWSGVFASPEQYQSGLYNNSSPPQDFRVWLISALVTSNGFQVSLNLVKGHWNDLRAVGQPFTLGGVNPPGQLYTQQTATGATEFGRVGTAVPQQVGANWDHLGSRPIAIIPPGWTLSINNTQGNTNLTPLTFLYEWGA